MGIDSVMSQVDKIGKEIFSYFNGFGRFYIQIQILCRVLVCSVFLDDLFGDPELTCDTKQVGCEQNCINRFAPINHQKLWEFELFLILCCLILFSAFAMFNRYAYRKWQAKLKKQGGMEPSLLKAKTMGVAFTDRQGRPIYEIVNAQTGDENLGQKALQTSNKPDGFDKTPYSKIVQIGYIFMLVVRSFIEFFCLHLELNLGRHQSQKAGFMDALQLKEMWLCSSNRDEAESSIERLIPEANRSIFWTDELNEPCVQQKVQVTCWIPFSRMKTWGMYFMYYVLILTFCITIMELISAVIELCRFKGSSSIENESRNLLDQHKTRYQSRRNSLNKPVIQPDIMPNNIINVADETDSLKKMPIAPEFDTDH